MKYSSLLLGSLLYRGLAAPKDVNVVHEKRDASSVQWIRREAAGGHVRVPVRIALRQKNLEKGPDYLLEVSDPTSPKYGQYYSADELVQLFGPDDGHVAAVKNWLVKAGVSSDEISSTRSKGWLDLTATVGQLESLLDTKYFMYDHVEARSAQLGTEKYHLPSDISPLVDFITPGVVMYQTGQPASWKTNGRSIRQHTPVTEHMVGVLAADPKDDCTQYITPACIKSLYNITEGHMAHGSNRLGIFQTSDDVYSQEDLDQFYTKFAKKIPRGTGPKVDLIDGAKAPTDQANAGGESDLDLEIAIPIIYPQKTELYEAVVQRDDIFNTFLDAVDGSYCTWEGGDDPDVDGKTPHEACGTFTPANVISFSYGASEAEFPTKYLQRQCDEFMKLGLRGVSVVFASGDSGVARRNGDCLGPNKDIFTPTQPASCPWVTTVGSTVLLTTSGDESATERFSSGGGFSNIFEMPLYQKRAVSSYFSKHDPGYKSYATKNGTIPTDGGGIYNKAGRGYPDVAALGDHGVVVVQGSTRRASGTSMSAPLVAAIFSRINEERLRIGKRPLGFVNPALYANPAMFNDVVVGDQANGGPMGDEWPSACGNNGFSAVEGWDPVTGLGTPNYPAMLEYFISI